LTVQRLLKTKKDAGKIKKVKIRRQLFYCYRAGNNDKKFELMLMRRATASV